MSVICNRQDVFDLSYTDFVALVNQTNVPPGSYTTLTKWINNSNIDANSRIIEFASTTGFSILNIAESTNASGLGIDISEQSILRANANAKNMNLDQYVTFEHHDATKYSLNGGFTHAIFGAALQFFPSPKDMLQHSLKAFDKNGKVLVCPFYVNKQIPSSVLRDAESVFGITPTTEKYKEVVSIYEGLRVEYEDRLDIYMETERELAHYCKSTIDRLKQTAPNYNE
ncbi:class I SAM-dependent methyltransferase [Vibrio campbellii]|uniref:Methyltransferase domain-containing protein n=1 Tax=Vibrio campbellii (strain ATCC BAA-1116) TaxID=2902295 RepID=A7N6S7_VIBC1|nr:methyltransferase domain-containing protein [Vibrio campbellii]ABU73963.1 hypothetical protein VIBHAR_06070 [Vibrio campbellii ATCC BAA-1116]AGU98465.1 hypothetical protein M892_21560 [Vibrio campbellii ATCC BAA-1116]MBT0124173.1 methyltransferase domain-containing protein [Vibrio campbellii]MBT0139105.1 methyltransferase domain-containing protein [Vibrio campbellii]MBT0143805.1 methyltransferase domain-containing protein [Vibrio campbellii]